MYLKPRPSCTITLDLDSRIYSKDLRQEIDRSWTFVAETLVHTHEPAAEGDPVVNFISVFVKLGAQSYLYDTDDEDARDNWYDFIEKHIRNMLGKIGNQVKIFNRRQRQNGKYELDFEYIEFELEAGELFIQFHLDSNGEVTEDHCKDATAVREALNAGLLGDKPARVILPAPAFYSIQQEVGLEAKRIRDEKRAEEEEAARIAEEAAREEAEVEAEEQFLESPALAAEAKAAEALKKENAAKDTEDATEDEEEAAEEDGAQTDEETEKRSDGEAEDGAEGKEAESDDEEATDEEAPLNADEIISKANAPLTEEEFQELYGFDEADFALDYHIWEVVDGEGKTFLFDNEQQDRLKEEDLDADMIRTIPDPLAEEEDEAADDGSEEPDEAAEDGSDDTVAAAADVIES
ncbi:MAG: hypothetical protein LUD25_03755 [Coriobacteriaceae bacterium]|nr:hypothetical protein [Coriobacteriaceae bacterium]